MSDILISAKGLKKQFGAVHAARNITVDIREQTVTSLIGTNGAGKTTFVNMLTGYLKPDEGTITYQNQDITGLSPRDITQMGIARSFQIPQLFITHTALENIEIALSVAKQPIQKAHAVLEQFGLEEFADLEAATLPEGIRKLLDIALATVAKPRVLLLDEPTSGVASDEKFAIMERIMDAVHQEKITTLFVEHDMDIVERYSEHVLAFYDGSIVAEGPPDSVLQHEKVLEYIIGGAPQPEQEHTHNA